MKNPLTFFKHTMFVLFSYQSIGPSDASKTGVMLLNSVCIPAYSELEVMEKTQSSRNEETWILEGEPRDLLAVMIALTVAMPR